MRKAGNTLLIVDNDSEVKAIESQFDHLKESELILLSGNFSQEDVASYENRGYDYFDEHISIKDSISISSKVENIAWNWFLSEKNSDISYLNGCSLGSAFSHSIEILLNTTFKYLFSFRKILHKNCNVYCSSEVEGIFLEVIRHLKSEIGFNLHIVNTKGTSTIITQGKRSVVMDVGGRCRDHSKLFLHTNLKQDFVFFLLLLIQGVARKLNVKKVLFIPAGKHDSYFEYVKNSVSTRNFEWVLPFSKLKDFYLALKGENKFFYLSSVGSKNKKDIKDIICKLKDNIESKDIDKKLLINIMNKHVFFYFQGAFNYFNNAVRVLNVLSPSLIVLSSESYENFVLIGQAARKLKIKTALLPHGIYGIGRSQYKSGRFSWIDYGFAVGNIDRDKFLSSKMKKERIYITGHPYFEKFLPKKQNIGRKYKKVLLLPPDVNPRRSGGKIIHEQDFYEDMVLTMNALGIDIVGIKVRNEYHFKSRSMSEEVIIKNNNLPVIAGNISFLDAVNDADFVIGPISTAVIEAGLLGLDYYIFDYKKVGLLSGFELCLCKYMNISSNTRELKENILKKSSYLPGCSVRDLIDVSSSSKRKGLFKKFENVVESLVH